ncbi:DUF6215 domain-containing protein [Streptomyces sp. NBC_00162]|uniref:DUF6215 domain-containing protein n=1 Tax=Streptomyces sp. NBC_00162 TaxID=2903629 RepID=UPI00214AC7D1|nr:DUF6215 domain-containing protein [Streptomyces sp. NBC_00162]UUU39616.1 DUF6215 domain-containing protein [Streptomyces sp. NBC_00162]
MRVRENSRRDEDRADRLAACSSQDQDLSAGYVSGAQLCTALNRPDPPALLGTPEEHALGADGGVSWFSPVGGAGKIAPQAKVQLQTYSVQLSASYDRLPVAETADLLGFTAQKTTVLGRPAASPAAWWSRRTRRTAAVPSRS